MPHVAEIRSTGSWVFAAISLCRAQALISSPIASCLCPLGRSHPKVKRIFYEKFPHLAICESRITLELGGILDIRKFN